MYESINISVKSCPWGGPVVDYTCPNKMEDWLKVLKKVADALNVKNDPNFRGVVVYAWMDNGNKGVNPVNPTDAFINELKA